MQWQEGDVYHGYIQSYVTLSPQPSGALSAASVWTVSLSSTTSSPPGCPPTVCWPTLFWSSHKTIKSSSSALWQFDFLTEVEILQTFKVVFPDSNLQMTVTLRKEEDLVYVTLDNIIFIWSSLSTDLLLLCEWKLHNTSWINTILGSVEYSSCLFFLVAIATAT